MEKRRLLQAKLTPEGHRGWEAASLDTGATMTALIEALGRQMASGWRPPAKVVKAARAIDRERYSRS